MQHSGLGELGAPAGASVRAGDLRGAGVASPSGWVVLSWVAASEDAPAWSATGLTVVTLVSVYRSWRPPGRVPRDRRAEVPR